MDKWIKIKLLAYKSLPFTFNIIELRLVQVLVVYGVWVNISQLNTFIWHISSSLLHLILQYYEVKKYTNINCHEAVQIF